MHRRWLRIWGPGADNRPSEDPRAANGPLTAAQPAAYPAPWPSPRLGRRPPMDTATEGAGRANGTPMSGEVDLC